MTDGDPSALIRVLNLLIESDLDAVEAYAAAIDRIGDGPIQDRLRTFSDDHRRHVEDLTAAVRALGGKPATKPDLRHFVRTGKVLLGGLAGERAVLAAMHANENDANLAYERATSTLGLTPALRALLERHLADERRHHGFIEARLGVSADSTVETLSPAHSLSMVDE